MKNFIAYYRVSTKKQGRSGLGLEAQVEIVKQHIATSGQVVAEYTEVESGKKNNRQGLKQALQHCQTSGATLIIAKLDRLSRDVEFIFSLKNSRVDFICCDIPDCNTLTLGIFATMAQYERERISQRITDALKAKKARGEVWNTSNTFTDEARAKAYQAISDNARQADYINNVLDTILLMREKGSSYRDIAAHLNMRGRTTRNGKPFTSVQVRRIEVRHNELIYRAA
ncbi:recombinase family protein [Rufibacter immobilis]|nr:recombinase family protein [Rufibacter immobilis]